MKVGLMNQIRCNLEEDGNLNIIKLKPSTQQNQRADRRQTLNQEDEKEHSPAMIEYQSTNHISKVSPEPTKCYSIKNKTSDSKR
jgi:hypothetical protein